MVKTLHITSLPLADPSLFIQHFVEKLDFKDRNSKVIKDAVKLAQRMSNDWIHEGRRPAGVAGACVLLAARMNNFRRSHAEIVAVAHVAEETLQRRLNEFKKTKSGALTVESFRASQKTEVSNPPSFDKNRELEIKIAKNLSDKEMKLKNIGKLSQDSQVGEDQDGNSSDEDTQEKAKARSTRKNREELQQAKKDKLLSTILQDCDLSENEITDQLARIMQNQKKNLHNAVYSSRKQSPLSEKEGGLDTDRPRNLVKNLPKTQQLLEKISSESKTFDDLDDAELDDILLTEEESKIKERLWTGLNHDFILAQEKKRLKQEADELTGNTSGSSRSKKQKSSTSGIPQIGSDLVNEMGISEALAGIGVDAATGEPLSAADSAKKMLSKKSFSKKINYATLGDLFENSRAGSADI